METFIPLQIRSPSSKSDSCLYSSCPSRMCACAHLHDSRRRDDEASGREQYLGGPGLTFAGPVHIRCCSCQVRSRSRQSPFLTNTDPLPLSRREGDPIYPKDLSSPRKLDPGQLCRNSFEGLIRSWLRFWSGRSKNHRIIEFLCLIVSQWHLDLLSTAAGTDQSLSHIYELHFHFNNVDGLRRRSLS